MIQPLCAWLQRRLRGWKTSLKRAGYSWMISIALRPAMRPEVWAKPLVLPGTSMVYAFATVGSPWAKSSSISGRALRTGLLIWRNSPIASADPLVRTTPLARASSAGSRSSSSTAETNPAGRRSASSRSSRRTSAGIGRNGSRRSTRAGAPCTTRYGAAERGSGSPLRLSEKSSASPIGSEKPQSACFRDFFYPPILSWLFVFSTPRKGGVITK